MYIWRCIVSKLSVAKMAPLNSVSVAFWQVLSPRATWRPASASLAKGIWRLIPVGAMHFHFNMSLGTFLGSHWRPLEHVEGVHDRVTGGWFISLTCYRKAGCIRITVWHLRVRIYEFAQIHQVLSAYSVLRLKYSRELGKKLEDFFRFCTNTTTVSQPLWVLAIPLFHFLRGHSKMCQPVKKANHENSDWWGTTSLKPLINKLQYHKGYRG